MIYCVSIVVSFGGEIVSVNGGGMSAGGLSLVSTIGREVEFGFVVGVGLRAEVDTFVPVCGRFLNFRSD